MPKTLSTNARPIVRQRLSDILVGKIHDHIVQGKLIPGDRLPTEQEMAKQYGVSRLAVREATKALGFLGILESSPRRGVTVGNSAFERVIPLLRVHPASRNIPPEELVATRVIIETGSLPYVMKRMAQDQGVYNRIKAINDKMETSTSLEEWIHRDIMFHNSILEESGLKILVTFGELLQLFFHRFREDVKPLEWKAGVEKHRLIIDHLRSGSLIEAVEALRSHISSHTLRIPEIYG